MSGGIGKRYIINVVPYGNIYVNYGGRSGMIQGRYYCVESEIFRAETPQTLRVVRHLCADLRRACELPSVTTYSRGYEPPVTKLEKELFVNMGKCVLPIDSARFVLLYDRKVRALEQESLMAEVAAMLLPFYEVDEYRDRELKKLSMAMLMPYYDCESSKEEYTKYSSFCVDMVDFRLTCEISSGIGGVRSFVVKPSVVYSLGNDYGHLYRTLISRRVVGKQRVVLGINRGYHQYERGENLKLAWVQYHFVGEDIIDVCVWHELLFKIKLIAVVQKEGVSTLIRPWETFIDDGVDDTILKDCIIPDRVGESSNVIDLFWGQDVFMGKKGLYKTNWLYYTLTLGLIPGVESKQEHLEAVKVTGMFAFLVNIGLLFVICMIPRAPVKKQDDGKRYRSLWGIAYHCSRPFEEFDYFKLTWIYMGLLYLLLGSVGWCLWFLFVFMFIIPIAYEERVVWILARNFAYGLLTIFVFFNVDILHKIVYRFVHML